MAMKNAFYKLCGSSPFSGVVLLQQNTKNPLNLSIQRVGAGDGT